MTTLNVKKLTPACGAVVTGIDLADLSDHSFQLIQEAWYENLVLIFPQQTVDPIAHQAFAERFGSLDVHPHVKHCDGAPGIGIIKAEEGGKADVWHTDVTYFEKPPAGCLAQYISGPEIGGDTMWNNQYLAYEKLSKPLQSLLMDLTAIHMSTVKSTMVFEQPAVRIHPVTGRKSLYVNRLFTRSFPQLNPRESAALLALLLESAELPELSCRWRWTPGDMVLWDNRCTQHNAINDYNEPRQLHRAIILGDTPVGSQKRWPDVEPPEQPSNNTGYQLRTYIH